MQHDNNRRFNLVIPFTKLRTKLLSIRFTEKIAIIFLNDTVNFE